MEAVAPTRPAPETPDAALIDYVVRKPRLGEGASARMAAVG